MENWIEVSLGEACVFSQGIQVPIPDQFTDSNDDRVRFLRIIDFTQGTEPPRYIKRPDDAYILAKDDIAMVRYGTVGFVCTGKEGAIANNLFKIIPKPEINKQYLIEFLKSAFFKQHLESKGATMQALSFGLIKPIKFPLPPLPEQRAIVAKIEQLFSELDNGIANFKTALEQLKVYRQAVLKKAFEGELTKVWRAKQTDLPTADELLDRIRVEREKVAKTKGKTLKELASLTESQTKELNKLPKGWCYIKLGNVGEVGTGATPKRGTPKYWEGGTISWVTSGALNSDFVNDANEFVTPVALKETNIKIFPKHTLLIAMYGEGKTRGKCSELLIEATTNQAIAAITLHSLNEQFRKFIKMFLLKNYQEIRRKSSGGVQPNINLDIIKNIKIPFCSEQEQHQIVQEIESRLSVCDKVEETIKDSLAKAEALRQSILKKAFEVKLLTEQELQACRQEPDWEPAEKLLERIKKEGSKAANRKSKKAVTAEAL